MSQMLKGKTKNMYLNEVVQTFLQRVPNGGVSVQLIAHLWAAMLFVVSGSKCAPNVRMETKESNLEFLSIQESF